MLTARNSPDKIDLAGKISTESKALIEPFLDQLNKHLTEDENQGPAHLAVIVYNLWQQNLSEDKFKDRLSNIQCQKIVIKSLFQDVVKRSGMVRVYSILT